MGAFCRNGCNFDVASDLLKRHMSIGWEPVVVRRIAPREEHEEVGEPPHYVWNNFRGVVQARLHSASHPLDAWGYPANLRLSRDPYRRCAATYAADSSP